MSTKPSKQLDTFPNPKPERDYEIDFECAEFTCVCPMTGQPDFATIRIRYVAGAKCVELQACVGSPRVGKNKTSDDFAIECENRIGIHRARIAPALPS